MSISVDKKGQSNITQLGLVWKKGKLQKYFDRFSNEFVQSKACLCVTNSVFGLYNVAKIHKKLAFNRKMQPQIIIKK